MREHIRRKKQYPLEPMPPFMVRLNLFGGEDQTDNGFEQVDTFKDPLLALGYELANTS